MMFYFIVTAFSCIKPEYCSGIDCEFRSEIVSGDLIDVIKSYQDKYVRKSHDIYHYQCFTTDDYNSFRSQKTVEKIVNELRKSKLLETLVLEIGKLSENERTELYKKGLRTYQPTWNELGKISVEGQTVAGQKAQKEIAEAIVNLVKEMVL